MATGLRIALRLSSIAGALYLVSVLVAILLEVRAFGPLFGSLAFYSLTALFAVATVLIHWRNVSRKPLALLSAVIFVCFVFSLAFVVGVNAKFWMGGAL
ncbi:hypothetical protein [Steroidobacter cummioxidans]|uniref:hypothetical protein n=1 Tax=Steroidobacter cummioxidans TaxID=1803913 RepID=UPI000E310030|nr:hypothetical protein [Steroidobacter cummioxidans]